MTWTVAVKVIRPEPGASLVVAVFCRDRDRRAAPSSQHRSVVRSVTPTRAVLRHAVRGRPIAAQCRWVGWAAARRSGEAFCGSCSRNWHMRTSRACARDVKDNVMMSGAQPSLRTSASPTVSVAQRCNPAQRHPARRRDGARRSEPPRICRRSRGLAIPPRTTARISIHSAAWPSSCSPATRRSTICQRTWSPTRTPRRSRHQ